MSHSQREEKGQVEKWKRRIFGGKKKKNRQSARKPFGKQNHDNRNATPGTREQKAKKPLDSRAEGWQGIKEAITSYQGRRAQERKHKTTAEEEVRDTIQEMSQNQNVPDMSAEVEELSGKELHEDKRGDERGSQANSEVPEHQRRRWEGVSAQSGRRIFTKDKKLEMG